MKSIVLSSIIGISSCAIAVTLTGCASTPTHESAGDPDVSAIQVGVETDEGQLVGVTRVENNILIKPLSGDETSLSVTNSVSEYKGEVTAMDSTNNTITVRKALISHTFQNANGLDRLGVHVGDRVKVSYQEKDGQNSVVRIDEVKPKDAAAQ